jgi:lipoic acid synthetase
MQKRAPGRGSEWLFSWRLFSAFIIYDKDGAVVAVMQKQTQEVPAWLKQRVTAEGMTEVGSLMRELGLNTVCQSADCPNIGECFGAHTATFLILGGVCTRHCRFCSVPKGRPEALDLNEPDRVALAVKTLGLRHAVITSVTRDDLPDGGAGLFAACVQKVRQLNSGTTLEVLVPDFGGDKDALATVLESAPDVFNHNIETVPRLYPVVRPEANYRRSLAVLRQAAEYGAGITKSGLMVGLGETGQEVAQVLQDLATAGVKAVTIGQYLRPSAEHLPVIEFVHPDKFKTYEKIGNSFGLRQVVAGPLVRSSYHAALLLDSKLTEDRQND